ncbi:TetR family transcriptional regulator [Nocardia abscessus]|uniref:TetR/AcrR family transcriptional regulator n=1 Tax=Nocardia abscessus TaxID=120957 RepID=UPI001893F7BD|nr:helix-turn-helix domain-containing protein [Nocardia abscessus]MBF6335426.1 TetR family transcriptional regulator [Nocardia abscessus]
MTEIKLHRAAIVDTAIELADTEGLDALSMRRIADRLGVGAMSLYRHVANKDELLALMTDEVARCNPYPSPEGQQWTWRERVRIAAEVDWALYRQHPWVLLTFATPRYSFGPQSLACLAWLVDGFLELGVSTREATGMAFTVWNYISGATLPEISAELMARKGMDPGGDNALRTLLNGTAAGPVPPTLADLAGSGVSDLTQKELLYDGLDALCDGFAARAERRDRLTST